MWCCKITKGTAWLATLNVHVGHALFARVSSNTNTESLVIRQGNANFVLSLEQHPKFQIQIYSKLVLSILLKEENRQNGHVHSVPQVKSFNKQFCYTILYFEYK